MQASDKSSGYFDGKPLGKAQYKFLAIATMAYFFDQMDLLNFSFVAPALQQHWGVSMEWIGLVTSMTFFGMMCGCWFGGWISDQIGRKPSFMISVSIFSVFSIINGLATTKGIFLLARSMTGFGVMAMVVITMVYMVEMLPSENRGKLQGITIGLGLLSAPLIGQFSEYIIPLSVDGWRYVFYVGGFGIVILILAAFWLTESPRWLVSKGRVDEAKKAVEKIVPGHQVKLSASNGISEKTSLKEVFSIIFGQSFARRTTILLFLTGGITVGTFMWYNWMPTVLAAHGFTLENSLFIAAIISFGSPIGDLISSAFSEKGGRKIPLVVYCIVIGLVAISYGFIESPLFIIGVGVFLRMMVEGVWIFLWTYLAESYPTKIRNTATGIVYSTGRFLTAIAMLCVPYIFKQYGYTILFVIIGLCFLIPGIITGLLGEHTAGRSLEDINDGIV